MIPLPFSCLQEKWEVVVPRRLPCLIQSALLPGASRPGLDGRWVWAPPPGRDLLDQASSHTRNPRSDSGAAGVSHTTLATIAARAPLRVREGKTRRFPSCSFPGAIAGNIAGGVAQITTGTP